jgi:DNA-binding response OmpR family regulator
MQHRILIVEDDSSLARILRDNLAVEGYKVESVADGRKAIAAARDFWPDLILLDVTLPDGNGFDLYPTLMAARRAEVIFLTARAEKASKLRGLRLNAADYITKPFDLEELLARVKNVLRRHRNVERLTLGTVTIDFNALTAVDRTQPIELTHREFELLRYLAERQKTVVDRNELLRELWGYGDDPITRSVDHAIARLRKKIEPDPRNPQFIHTVYGEGYLLTPEGATGTVQDDVSQ